MRNLLTVLLALALHTVVIAQCNCYTVEGIAIPTDTTGIMTVTFKNTCDDNVYLSGWVITNSNDTIGRFDDCACGLVLPFNQPNTWNFITSLSTLPDLSTLRVSITNLSLVCPDVQFSALLANKSPDDISLVVAPNPAKSVIHFTSKDRVTQVVFHTSAGSEVLRVSDKAIESVNVSGLLPGIYTIQIQFENQKVSIQKIVIE